MDIKILVVDDEESIRSLFTRFFGNTYKLDIADSFEHAIELVKTQDYDIIITDKNLPDNKGNIEGGIELLKYARTHLLKCEFIIMTGYATMETAIQAMHLGAFDYITKPFSFEEMKEKIDHLVQFKRFVSEKSPFQDNKTLHNEMLLKLKNKNSFDDDDIYELSLLFDIKVEHLFKKQKSIEKIVVEQRKILDEIASYAHELKEKMASKQETSNLVEKILKHSRSYIYTE